MKKFYKLILLVMVSNLQSFVASSQEFKLLNFRAGAVGYYNSTGNSQSVLGSWNPEYAISERYTVRANLALSHLKNSDQTKFWVQQYHLSFGARFSQYEIEALLGGQNWGPFGNHFSYGGNAHYYFEEPIFAILDRIVLGYQQVSVSSGTHQVSLSAGFQF